MEVLRGHKLWWAILLILTVIVSVITSAAVTVLGLVSSVIGHLLFAVLVSFIPFITYSFLKKPMSSEEHMATISMGWLILAVANISVM